MMAMMMMLMLMMMVMTRNYICYIFRNNDTICSNSLCNYLIVGPVVTQRQYSTYFAIRRISQAKLEKYTWDRHTNKLHKLEKYISSFELVDRSLETIQHLFCHQKVKPHRISQAKLEEFKYNCIHWRNTKKIEIKMR